MSAITKLVVRAREYSRGQTMAEYALILAAVAVVVFVGYQTMGTTITTLLGESVDTKLSQSEKGEIWGGGATHPPPS